MKRTAKLPIYYTYDRRSYNAGLRRHLNYRPTRLDIILLIVLAAILLTILLGALIQKATQPSLTSSPLGASFQFARGEVYAEQMDAKPKPYRIPTLNPNESERQQNIDLIRKIWGQDAGIGLAIARCESGYRTAGAHVANSDGSVDQGVFSINSTHTIPNMENATANISYAYTMYLKQGTTPWDSSSSCWR